MRKLTRKSLEELAQRMPVLSEEVQSSFVGGGIGTKTCPYTLEQYKNMGTFFKSGWVDFPDSVTYLKTDYYSYFGISVFENTLPFKGLSGILSGNVWMSGNVYNYKGSCVFNCLDYLDNDKDGVETGYNWRYYSKRYLDSGGTVDDKNGGVNPNDIEKIVGYGGFKFGGALYDKEISYAFNCELSADGMMYGNSVMLTFSYGEIDHAVIVTGKVVVEGKREFKYYDPTTGKKGTIPVKEATGLYVIGTKN